MSYANKTTVTVEKTQSDIIHVLKKYNADGFLLDWKNNRLGFQINNRNILLTIKLPDRNDKQYNLRKDGGHLTEKQGNARYNQKIRSLWRSLFIIIKAKFIAIESGITDIDQEFLSHFILNNGQVMIDYLRPQLKQGNQNLIPKLPEKTSQIGMDRM